MFFFFVTTFWQRTMKPASRRRVPLQSAHVLSFYNQEQSWQRSNTSHAAEDDGWCHSTELQLVRGSSFVLRFPMRVERITPAARGWSAPSHVASASWHRGLNRISGISVGRFRRVHCRSFTRPGRAGLWQLSPGRGTGAALSAVFWFFFPAVGRRTHTIMTEMLFISPFF